MKLVWEVYNPARRWHTGLRGSVVPTSRIWFSLWRNIYPGAWSPARTQIHSSVLTAERNTP